MGQYLWIIMYGVKPLNPQPACFVFPNNELCRRASPVSARMIFILVIRSSRPEM